MALVFDGGEKRMAVTLKDQIPELAEQIEETRAETRKKYVVMMAVGIPLLVVGLIVYFSFTISGIDGMLYMIPTLLAVFGVSLIAVAGLMKHNYNSNACDLLEEAVDSTLFPDAEKDPDRGMAISNIMKPGFFQTPDRYCAKNYKKCSYGGVPFEQAGYDLQRREEHTDSKGNSYYTYDTYARGTMYHFIYDRSFTAVVKVLERGQAANFGNDGLGAVETEYIAFNKKFKILTNDETLVFYLLTPQIQEKIMSLEERFKGQFYMAFMGDELFIAVNDGDESFRLPFKEEVTVESLTPIVECLAIPAVFVSLLGLNKAKFEANAGTVPQNE